MNWEKAKRESRRRKEKLENRFEIGKQKYRDTLEEFALKNHLGCFKCKTQFGPFAKSGKNKYGFWIICVECVSRKS